MGSEHVWGQTQIIPAARCLVQVRLGPDPARTVVEESRKEHGVEDRKRSNFLRPVQILGRCSQSSRSRPDPRVDEGDLSPILEAANRARLSSRSVGWVKPTKSILLKRFGGFHPPYWDRHLALLTAGIVRA